MLFSWLAWATCVIVVHGRAPCSRWDSAFLTNVTSGLPDSTREQFCSDASSNRLIASPASTGVSHYALAGSLATSSIGKNSTSHSWPVLRVGELAANDVEQTAVVLHIWLRAVCIGSNTTIRGFGMLQSIYLFAQNTFPHGQMELEMLLTPLSGPSDQQHRLELFWRDENEGARFSAPFTVEATFPYNLTAPHYQLHVGGFMQHVVFTPRVSSCQPVIARQNPILITVLPHSHTNIEDAARLQLATQMLIKHVHHHLKLGLAGTVHYDVEPFLSQLASNSEIQALIAQGSLRLITFDIEVQGFMPTGLVWNKNSAKALQYNHAILAHWGLDVYLNPLDIDEFMATNSPMTVAQLVENQCIVPGGQTLLYRFDIRCGTCQANESSIWSHATENPLSFYNETDWQIRLRGKPIVYADTSFSMSIHEAGDFHGGAALWKPVSCMFHIHVVNVFGYRRGTSHNTKFSNDTSWDWLVQPALL